MTHQNKTTRNFERYRRTMAKLRKNNKSAVFDALAAANITEVHVQFDGVADSGQIESVIALSGDKQAALPETKVTVQQATWRETGETNAVATEQTFREAIETLCYDYLAETHEGWEINDGAFGEFSFNVANRTVALEFNGRFSDTYTDNHTF
jgi:hypothetical protein